MMTCSCELETLETAAMATGAEGVDRKAVAAVGLASAVVICACTLFAIVLLCDSTVTVMMTEPAVTSTVTDSTPS